MPRRNVIVRLLLSGMLACLLTASLQAKPAAADESIETPTITETFEATLTPEESTGTPSSTSTETATTFPETGTAVTGTAKGTQTTAPSITAAPLLRGSYVPNEVLVRFKNSATDEMIAECLGRVNGRIDSLLEEISVTVVRIDSLSVSNAVATISACEGVRYVEPNYLAFSADTIPNDTGWANPYGLVNIRAPQGWDFARGSSSIVIAIVDSGVDLGHPDLSAKIVAGYDFVNNDPIAQDDNGHGTHVAGISAAVTNNGSGVAGVSWGARLMPVKVMNAAGTGTVSDIASGIIWAADHGAQIINLSIGGKLPVPSLVLQNAVNYAAGKGTLLIAASGNSGENSVFYPAAYPNVIAVGATNSSNTLAPFSNYGAEIDLVAPGVSIYSTANGGAYGFNNGTSMAAPFVSGLAAILRGLGNSPGAVRSLMESTALDLGAAGWDMFHGSGLIQMDAAILLGLPPSTSPNNSIYRTPLVFLPGGYLPTPTYTPSPTATLTAPVSLTETQTATITATPIGHMTYTFTPNPEVVVLETETAGPAGSGSDWLIPCCGLLLILFGILMLWLAPHRKRHRNPYLK